MTIDVVAEKERPARAGRSRLATLGALANLVVQLGLVGLVAGYLWATDLYSYISLLATWAAVATVYLAAVVIVMWRMAQRPASTAPRARPHPASRVGHTIATVAMLTASVTGLIGSGFRHAADTDATGILISVLGVWSMLLSWALLHWGFAQLYHRRYHMVREAPLTFPATPSPRMSDFFAFAFTIATSFAVSDVAVRSPSMRWTVTWHGVLAFFYNGAIIVVALNKLTGGP